MAKKIVSKKKVVAEKSEVKSVKNVATVKTATVKMVASTPEKPAAAKKTIAVKPVAEKQVKAVAVVKSTAKKPTAKAVKISASKQVKSVSEKQMNKVEQTTKAVEKTVADKSIKIAPTAKHTAKTSAKKQPTPSSPITPPKNSKGKLCRIVSYEKLEPKVKKQFDIKFDDGYEELIERFTRKSGEYFYAVRFETEDTEYLVKVDVDLDLVGYEEDDIVVKSNDDVDVSAIENTVADTSSDDDTVE
ncbi:MAG: hypothetical protein LBF01_05425 [Bacteroidales bacterium]|nr:hypothetical protein [Bacteroidales bacterium]